MLSGYFVWWYSTGINQAYTVATSFMGYVADSFSLPILVKTLFAPWKNDVLTARNASLADQIKVWQLNFASRLAGFIIRLIVIFATVLVLAVMLILTGMGLTLWILVPILVVVLPLVGVGRLFG